MPIKFCVRILTAVVFFLTFSPVKGAEGTLKLENDHISIKFSRNGNVVSLCSPAGNQYQWLSDPGTMAPFSIGLQKFDGKTLIRHTYNPKTLPVPTCKLVKNAFGEQIIFEWKDLKVHSDGTCDVKATVTLNKDSAMAEWNIMVSNHVKDFGLEEVTYPHLYINADKNSCLASPRPGLGRLYKNPASYKGEMWERIKVGPDMGGVYPFANFTMQFMGLSFNNQSLYMATHDRMGKGKVFSMKAAGNGRNLLYSVSHWPEAPMQSPYKWQCSYPVVVGLVKGDWWHCCREYRKWVYASAEWMQYPLSRTPDQLPDYWKKVSIWDHAFYKRDNRNGRRSLPYIKELQKNMDGQDMMVMYGTWAWIGFDINYPNLFPARPWFIKDAAEALKSRIHFTCYMNGTDACADGSYWLRGGYKNEALINPARVQEKSYSHPELKLARPVKLAHVKMCPHTSWAKVISDMPAMLVNFLGVDSVYIDVVNATRPYPCYSTEHGHAPGNRCDWPVGYRNIIRQARQKAYKYNPNVVFSSEAAIECYGIESPFMTNETIKDMNLPMMMAVYADRMDPFGYTFPEHEYKDFPMNWRTKLAEMFIYGMKVGVIGHGKTTGKPEIITMLKELAKARTKAYKYLSVGQMMHPPVLSGDNPVLQLNWESPAGLAVGRPKMKGTRTTVRASTWLADDGTIALAFVNVSDKPLTLQWKQKIADSGIIKAENYYIRNLLSGGNSAKIENRSGWLEGVVTVPPRGPAVYVISTNKN